MSARPWLPCGGHAIGRVSRRGGRDHDRDRAPCHGRGAGALRSRRSGCRPAPGRLAGRTGPCRGLEVAWLPQHADGQAELAQLSAHGRDGLPGQRAAVDLDHRADRWPAGIRHPCHCAGRAVALRRGRAGQAGQQHHGQGGCDDSGRGQRRGTGEMPGPDPWPRGRRRRVRQRQAGQGDGQGLLRGSEQDGRPGGDGVAEPAGPGGDQAGAGWPGRRSLAVSSVTSAATSLGTAAGSGGSGRSRCASATSTGIPLKGCAPVRHS